MDTLNYLTIVLTSPAVVIWLIGAALALTRWRRHPRVSLFALLAFAMLLVNRSLSVFLPIMRSYGWSEFEPGSVFFTVVWIINALTSIVAWAFVLCAIFGWRDEPQKQNPSPVAVDFRQ